MVQEVGLWRHVQGSADTVAIRRVVVMRCESEIGDLGVVVHEKDVCWLDVSVYDVLLMHDLGALNQLIQNL